MATEERDIQYYGIYKPSEDVLKAKKVSMSIDIVGRGENEYRNRKYEPSRTWHGYYMFMVQGRVLLERPIEFDHVCIDTWFNSTSYLHVSLSCAVDALLQSFANLGLSLGATPVILNNPIEDRVNPFALGFIDEVRIRLRTEKMRCKFICDYNSLEDCEVEGSEPPDFPLPPPDKPNPLPDPLPPNTPDEDFPPNSPAYDGETDDGTTYKPTPEEPPPTGDLLIPYLVVIHLTQPDGIVVPFSGIFWGPIAGVVPYSVPARPDEATWSLVCGGGSNVAAPVPGTLVTVFSGHPADSTAEVVSVTPYQ